MAAEAALRGCEALARSKDSDRYLAALFAPAHLRPFLFALYAFNFEIARISESVREPMMAAIRRQWWREAVEEAAAGRPRRHDVAEALAELFVQTHADPARFILLIDARAKDDSEDSFADLLQLEAYADQTAGEVMRIGARILGAGNSLDPLSRAAGIAYGLTGLLRALPFRAARARLDLPLDLLAELGLSRHSVLAGRGGKPLTAALHRVGDRALCHLDAARAFHIGPEALPAFLPTSLCELYLKRLLRPGFEPFRDSTEIALWRRQLILLVNAVRTRI